MQSSAPAEENPAYARVPNGADTYASGDDAPSDASAFWRRLMHRWFVQYNPLYLLSATLVLGGIWLLSREAAREVSVVGQLGLALLAEAYAFALIGGAAFLWRIELRRPAVMLALLAVLYQGDLTLHLETCAYLGVTGRVASAVWVALFFTKLLLLARALELRASRSALLVPTLGALALAALPHIFREVGPDDRTAALGLAVFIVGAAACWTSRQVHSAVGFDVRGRRALRGTWAAWTVLGLAHVAYWSTEHQLDLRVLMPVAALLCARLMESERKVWTLAALTLGPAAFFAPTALSSLSLGVAVVLALRAFRSPETAPTCEPPPPVAPYRGATLQAPPAPAVQRFELAPRRARERLVLGAVACLYLSAWTVSWTGGAWPAHIPLLDLLLVVIFMGAAMRARRFARLAPPVVAFGHLAVQVGWLAAPATALGWGITSVGLGFACLLVSLLMSWRLRPEGPDTTRPA